MPVWKNGAGHAFRRNSGGVKKFDAGKSASVGWFDGCAGPVAVFALFDAEFFHAVQQRTAFDSQQLGCAGTIAAGFF